MMAEVEDLEKECEDLAQNDDDNSKTRLTELVQEIEEYQESLKEVNWKVNNTQCACVVSIIAAITCALYINNVYILRCVQTMLTNQTGVFFN